jgi:integrase
MHTHEVTLPKRCDALAGNAPPAAANPPRLLDEIRRAIRYRHYSYRTEQVYVEWTRRFVRFHAMRHPREMGGDEVHRVLALMEGTHALMARLLYGTGMRLMECVRLRVNDLDLARGEIVVRRGKGGQDRVTMLRADGRSARPACTGACAVRGRPMR